MMVKSVSKTDVNIICLCVYSLGGATMSQVFTLSSESEQCDFLVSHTRMLYHKNCYLKFVKKKVLYHIITTEQC